MGKGSVQSSSGAPHNYVERQHRKSTRPGKEFELPGVAEMRIRLAASLVQVSTPVVDVNRDDAVASYVRTYLAPLVH